MESGLQKPNSILANAVDQAILQVDSAGPKAGEVVA
jgi:hypothetical protein